MARRRGVIRLVREVMVRYALFGDEVYWWLQLECGHAVEVPKSAEPPKEHLCKKCKKDGGVN